MRSSPGTKAHAGCLQIDIDKNAEQHTGHTDAGTQATDRQTQAARREQRLNPLTSKPYLYRITQRWHSAKNSYVRDYITVYFGVL